MNKNSINFFGICRKDTPIMQSDMATLMDYEDSSLISRCEGNGRVPSLEMALVYHLFFNIPIATFVTTHRETIKEKLVIRISRLIERLLQEPLATKVQQRIEYLTKVQTRLSEEQRHG